MSMDKFFDNIKSNINQRSEPEFEKSAWKGMEMKLDAELPATNFARRLIYILLPLIGLLLISNIGLFYKLQSLSISGTNAYDSTGALVSRSFAHSQFALAMGVSYFW